MSLRPREVLQVCDELEGRLRGGFVQKAYAPRPRLAYLELRQPGRSMLVCLSAEPEVARVSVAAERAAAGEPAAAFQRALRHHLSGARLEAVQARADGRAVSLRFARAKRGPPLTLVVELFRGRLVLANADERPLVWSPPGPAPTVDAPDAPLSPDERPSRLAPPFPEAAEALLGARAVTRYQDELRRRAVGPLAAKLKRLERTLQKVAVEAERAPLADEHRRHGELLAQNLARLERGQKQVVLTDFGSGTPVEVTLRLDPALSPREQVERHFRQYRRLLRGSALAQVRLAKLSAERDQLRAELVRLEQLDPAKLEEAPPAPRRTAPSLAKPYKEYRSQKGAPIWVGKGGAANDALTFGLAKPHHLWLHARGAPGAHVVVPLDKGAKPSDQLVLDAAHLALHHSDLKAEPWGEVACTQVKHVRRTQGSPGAVSYTREKTLRVEVDFARLRRLLEAKV